MLKAQFANREEEEDITEWTRANTEFTILEQGDRTDDEYVRYVKELFGVLGGPFGMALASKFIQGIRDPTTRLSTVNCMIGIILVRRSLERLGMREPC